LHQNQIGLLIPKIMPYDTKEKQKAYYQRNKKKISSNASFNYQNNKEKKKQYGREYYAKNKVLKVLPTKKQLEYWKSLREKKPWNFLGISSENKMQRNCADYALFRRMCFERDNFICQKTGISGGELEVHHINNFADFPELRFDVSNGITLSKQSHREFHKKYGKRNNTMKQLIGFLNNDEIYFNPENDWITHT